MEITGTIYCPDHNTFDVFIIDSQDCNLGEKSIHVYKSENPELFKQVEEYLEKNPDMLLPPPCTDFKVPELTIEQKNQQLKYERKQRFTEEADRLFWKWQEGEEGYTKERWLEKKEEIRKEFDYIIEDN